MDATVTRRADARRNVEAILDAATECLARNPRASVNEIAVAAGVARVTLYGHFGSRAALVAAVARRALDRTDEVLAAVDVTGDPVTALTRLLDATCELTNRLGGVLVAADDVMPGEDSRSAHERLAQRVEGVLRRGRDAGTFRSDMPVAWQVRLVHAVVHASSAAVDQGEVAASRAPGLVREAVLGAVLSDPCAASGRSRG